MPRPVNVTAALGSIAQRSGMAEPEQSDTNSRSPLSDLFPPVKPSDNDPIRTL